MQSRTLNESNHPASATTNLAEGTASSPRDTSDSRTSSAGDARETLRCASLVLLCLAGGVLGGLGGLLGGGALVATESDPAQGRGAEGRTGGGDHRERRSRRVRFRRGRIDVGGRQLRG